jgi:hypothetical protein
MLKLKQDKLENIKKNFSKTRQTILREKLTISGVFSDLFIFLRLNVLSGWKMLLEDLTCILPFEL